MIKKILIKNKILIIFILILITFYRSPYILTEGRFLAEEGYIWYRNVFLNGQLDTLFFIYFFSGYFNLSLNLAGFLSGFIPIEYAPLIFVYFSFSILIFTFIYILNSNSSLLPTTKSKYVACMIVLFSPIMTPEIWLNTLHAMSYLGILTFLIIFENYENSRFSKINPFIIILSGLSGIYSVAFTPIYFLKYYFTKNKVDLINFLVISFCSIIQLIIIVISKLNQEIAEDRFFISFDKVFNFIYNAILKAVFGREFLQKLIQHMNLDFLKILSVVFLILSITIFIREIILKKDRILSMIVLALFIQSLLVLIGAAYQDFAGGRYAVVSGVIVLFALLRLFYLYIDNYKKNIIICLISFSLIMGFIEFKQLTKYPHFLACIECPNWKDEVSKWEKDKNYELKIWNYGSNTKMKLY